LYSAMVIRSFIPLSDTTAFVFDDVAIYFNLLRLAKLKAEK